MSSYIFIFISYNNKYFDDILKHVLLCAIFTDTTMKKRKNIVKENRANSCFFLLSMVELF